MTIDNLSTGYQDNIPEGAMFFQGDCQDSKIYEKLPREKFEAIFHLAGQSSGEVSFDDPIYDLRSNTESTLRLLDFAVSTKCQHFIYGSSMSVYGDKPDLMIREDESTRPISFYAVSKLGSEQYLRIYEQYGVRSTVLRFFSVYGPGQNLHNSRQGMVSIFLAHALEKRHIEVRGSGSRYRDFVYIDDVVDACLACLTNPEAYGQVVNIGSGVRTTVSELLEQIIKLLPYPVTYEIQERGTPGDTYGSCADIMKAKKILDYSPHYSLTDGLKKMVEWALKPNFFSGQ